MNGYSDSSGFAFPGGTGPHYGLSRREWYATWAPEPSAATVADAIELDKRRYFNASQKRLSTVHEILAELRFAHADAMLVASSRGPR